MQLKIAYLFTLSCFLFGLNIKAQDTKFRKKIVANPIKKDTIFPQEKDSLLTISRNGLLNKKTDSIVKDSIKKPKEVIDYVVTHNAEDYTIQNAKNKTVTLHNKAHVVYGDIDLKAGRIIVDYKKNTVFATGIKDSTGYKQRPVFKQGSQESEQDSILFNFKSKKALVYGIKTVQGEMITYGNVSKRVNDSTVYMRKLRFTTSKKKIPDYYIATDKAKLVPGKKIIVGGSNLVIADVPTPLWLPFAYFPLTQERASGFIIPSWGEDANRGFNLQNGGYYFAVNDYLDLTLLGGIFTNGSWDLSAQSNYNVRYKFSGNFRVRYQNLVNSIRGFNDYSKQTIYNIDWSHRQDTKSSPTSNFSASVNLGSSRFFRESVNQRDQSRRMANTLNSSINYSKRFVGTPFNISIGLGHSQNSNTQSITMTFPSFTLGVEPINPFEGKGGIRKTPLQKMSFNYGMQGQYSVDTTEDEFFTAKMFRDAKSGIQQTLSTGTSLKAFKYFTLSPSVNYREVWLFKTISKRYDARVLNSNGNRGAVVNDTISGFRRFNDYGGGVGLSTNIYGMFNFKKGRLKAIRHVIRPNISWSYSPDVGSKYIKKVQQGPGPTELLSYSPFDNAVYSGPSNSLSNSISISINNTLEAKVSPKDEDSDEEDKKITILNNLSLSQSYNFAADSLNLSSLSLSAGTSLFKNKMSINFSSSFNPYQVTKDGKTINKLNKGFYRLQSAGITANLSLSSTDFSKKDKNKNTTSQDGSTQIYENTPNDSPINSFSTSLNKNKNQDTEKKAKLYHSNIPWNISLGYSVSYQNDGYRKSEIGVHSIDFHGSIELTPKWRVGYRSGYDIKNGGFAHTSFDFSRDLDSWRFSFNWIPFGRYTSYNFFIGVKSSMLSDLKWDKQKPPDRRLF